MTLLCCSKLSGRERSAELRHRVLEAFPGENNREYIDTVCRGKNDKSVAESLSALILLSESIKKLYQAQGNMTNHSLLTLKKREHGKPYFKDSPIRFSISHSQGHIAIAVSDTGEVGVDIETKLLGGEKAIRLAKRYFSEDETAAIKANPDIFARLWTQKEAEAKLYGIPLGKLLAQVGDKTSNSTLFDQAPPIYFSFFEFCGYPVTVCKEDKNDIVNFVEL